MAGISLAQAMSQLQTYLDAEAAVLSNQEYRIGTRMLKRADLEFIQTGIETWDRRVKDLSSKASGIGRVASPRPRW